MFNKQSSLILLSTVVSVGLTASFSPVCAQANPLDTSDNPNELIRMGKQYAKEANHIEAIRKYSKAIKLSDVNHYAYFYRARSRKALGDFQNAVEDYNYVIKLNPKSSKAYCERGWCLMKLDLPQRAIKDLNKAINLNDKNYKAYQYRSQIKYKLNDYQGALSDFNRVLKLKPNSSKNISKFLFPKNVNLVKKKTNPSKKANTSADGTVSIIATSKTGKFEQKDLAQINNKAAKAIKSGKFEQAVKILESITEKHPDYDFARRNLTIAYNNFGLKLARSNTKESVNKFRYALYYTPTEVTARRNLNAVLEELGHKPKSHETRINMGNELLKSGNLKLAFVEFTEALRLRNDPKVRRKLAEVCLELDSQKTKEESSKPVAVASTPKPQTPATPQAKETSATTTAIASSIASAGGPKINFTLNKPQNESLTQSPKVAKPEENKQVSISIPVATASKVTPQVEPPQATKQEPKPVTKPLTIAIKPPVTKIAAAKPEPKKVQAPKPALTKLQSLSLPPPASPIRPTTSKKTIEALQPKFSLSKEAILASWNNHMDFGQQRFDEGDYLGAESSFDKAASLAEGLGGDTKELAMSLEKLAEIYVIHRKVSQAYSLLARALVILSRHHKVDDPKLVNLRAKLDKLSAVIDGNSPRSQRVTGTNIANSN